MEGHLLRLWTIFRSAWKEGLLSRPTVIEVRDFPRESRCPGRRRPAGFSKPPRAVRDPGPYEPDASARSPADSTPSFSTLCLALTRRGELIHLPWSESGGQQRRPRAPCPPEDDGNRVRMSGRPKGREVRDLPGVRLLPQAGERDLQAASRPRGVRVVASSIRSSINERLQEVVSAPEKPDAGGSSRPAHRLLYGPVNRSCGSRAGIPRFPFDANRRGRCNAHREWRGFAPSWRSQLSP
jgi:hypothetical protein